MKKYKATSLEKHLNDLDGTPQDKVKKLVSIHYIYTKPITESNFNKYLYVDQKDFEIHGELDEDGNLVDGGVLFYWSVPILTHPKTIGEFITIATALNREIFWDNDTWVEYIYISQKY